MADVVWEDMNCRARKVEGGYESVLNWDEEELVVNFIPFEVIARSEEEELGRKPTPEEVDQRCLEIARNPKSAIVATPPPPRPGEEGIGEIANNWERVRKFLGMSDLEGELAFLKKQMEKERINSSFKGIDYRWK